MLSRAIEAISLWVVLLFSVELYGQAERSRGSFPCYVNPGSYVVDSGHDSVSIVAEGCVLLLKGSVVESKGQRYRVAYVRRVCYSHVQRSILTGTRCERPRETDYGKWFFYSKIHGSSCPQIGQCNDDGSHNR